MILKVLRHFISQKEHGLQVPHAINDQSKPFKGISSIKPLTTPIIWHVNSNIIYQANRKQIYNIYTYVCMYVCMYMYKWLEVTHDTQKVQILK